MLLARLKTWFFTVVVLICAVGCEDEDAKKKLTNSGASANMICKVDARCDENPSLRSLDYVRCPLGFVWYAMGLPLMK